MSSAVLQAFTPHQAWIAVALCLAGAAYAVGFRHDRAALGFVLLLWLAVGLGAATFVESAPWRAAAAGAAAGWLPWNLLLAALLPAFPARSRTAVGVLAVLAAEYLAALWWQFDGALINARIDASLPQILAPLSPIEQPLLALAALAFFVRWQRGSRTSELMLCLSSSLMLLAVLRPEWMFVALLTSAGLLLSGVIYASHRMAFIDPLTGLRNRRALEAALVNPGRNFAIGMLDIDHFKRINDRYGHDFGDQVLKMVATRIRRHRRCRAFRYGGEEFCLLFRVSKAARAKGWCEEIRVEVGGRPIVPRGPQRPPRKPLNKGRYRKKAPQLKVTVSIGLALSGGRHESVAAVLEAADKALYRAKRNGRDRVALARS